MAVGFNDTFDGDTDFSAVATYNMFVDAVNERFYYSGGPSGFPISHVSAGDDFQVSSLVSVLQNAISVNIGLFRQVNNSADGRTWDGTEVAPGIPVWTWANYKTAYLSGNEWTRKYPREFSTAASTTYTDASAFANGHHARQIDTGFVYTRTAGAWVAASAGTLPDDVTAYGTAAAGDYVGVWLWTEIRDALKRLVWMLAGQSIVSGNTHTQYVGGGDDASWATAKSIAEASWPSSPSSSGNFFPHAYTAGTGNVVFSHAVIGTGQSVWTVTGVGPALVANNPNAVFDFYVAMDTPDSNGQAGGAMADFDANGDGWSYRVWKKYDSQAQGGSASVSAVAIGHTTGLPNWCGDPSSGTNTSRGYRSGAQIVIQRMDVAGGFTYY